MTNEMKAQQAERLLDDGWACHGEGAEQLARELEESRIDGIAPENLAQLIHLSVHTIGEHLGDWPRALRVGKRILDGRTPTSRTARAWGRLSVAAALAGDVAESLELELSCLEAAGEDLGSALLDMRLMFVDALISAKRSEEAARLYRRVLDVSGQIRQSPVLERTIAVASNNISWELYELPSRTPDDDALMKLSAETSYQFWLKCGDWINEECAHYLKAVVANATGDPAAGLANADAGLAIVAANGERPLDTERLQLARAEALAAIGDRDAARRATVAESPTTA